MDPVAIARSLAAAHPAARLPCPVCAASLNASNLDRHLAKTHGGASPPPASRWRGKGLFGLFPCEIAFEGDTVVLRHSLGLGRRVVRLPCSIEIGTLTRVQSDAVMSSYADEMNVEATQVRAGRYLRLEGERAVTIACRHGTEFKAHWDRSGWREGGRRPRSDIVVEREAFVAIQYALADRGLLSPATR